MDVELFDYELPEELISQEPAPRRDGSRLLVLPRHVGAVRHRMFSALPELLAPGDVLVVNDVRVMRARLLGQKKTGGRVEVLAMRPATMPGDGALWHCLVGSGRRPRPGQSWQLDGGGRATLVADKTLGEALVRFEGEPGTPLDVRQYMREHGELPLPPYIKRHAGDPRRRDDDSRYQTIFAGAEGAVAAPTAGLHFTDQVFAALAARQVQVARLTLNVGPGTFRPVTVTRAEDHVLDPETFHLPAETVDAIMQARDRGGRVIACGTTVVRVLESCADEHHLLQAGDGECALYIRPGYRFRVVNGLLTNFHLPRSTLLMLVSALAGRERVLEAYRQAVERGYRFYSYGDAMLIPPESSQ